MMEDSARARVVRASIDSFHRPRAERWRRGRTSPAGFYLDSHELDAVRRELLDPFRAGPGHTYVTEWFNELTDRPIEAQVDTVAADDVLVFDGIFSQRPELAGYWDVAVFLDAQRRVGLQRLGLVFDELPSGAVEAATSALEWAAKLERYAGGMRLYLDLVAPDQRCDILIDNNDLVAPIVTLRPAIG